MLRKEPAKQGGLSVDFDDISNKVSGKNETVTEDLEGTEIGKVTYNDHFELEEGEAALVFRLDGSRELVIKADKGDDDMEVPETTVQAFSIMHLMAVDEDFVGIIDDNADEIFGPDLEDESK